MNDIWVLSVKTSLPGKFFNSNDATTIFTAFDSFEKGRAAMRAELKKYAFSRNAMFDGNGKINRLSQYIATMDDEDAEQDDEVLTKEILSAIEESLKLIFEGNDISLEALDEGYYHDWLIYMEFFGIGFAMGAHNDSDQNNTYNPDINTNMFSMQEEKDYYMYIKDSFGQNDAPAVLFMDLKKVSVN